MLPRLDASFTRRAFCAAEVLCRSGSTAHYAMAASFGFAFN